MSPYALDIIKTAAFFALGALLAYYIRRASKAEEEKDKITDRLKKLEDWVLIADVTAKPFWAAAQTKLVKDLTHPHERFKRPDRLLEKLEDLTITTEERVELHGILEERITTDDPEVNEAEKASAKIMLDIMDKVLKEAATDAPLTNVHLVGVKAENGE